MTTFHGAKLLLTADQALTDGQLIAWDTAEFDTDGFFSGGDPTRLTIPNDGQYVCGFNLDGGDLSIVVPGTDQNAFGVLLNSDLEIAAQGDDSVRTFASFNASVLADFTAGDIIEVRCDCSNGSTVFGPPETNIASFWIFRYT